MQRPGSWPTWAF